MTEINIPQEQIDKIKKFVEKGSFKSVDEFIEQAARLLIYAEERKDDFAKILKQ